MAEQSPLTRAHVLNVVLTYAAVASLWILLSDKAVEWLFSTPAQFALASTIKGWLFILITALMLYAMLRRRISQSTASPRLSGRQWLPIVLLNGLILALAIMAIAQNIGLTRDKEVQDLRQILDNPSYGALSLSGQRDRPSDEQTQRLIEFISVRGFDGAALFDRTGQALWQTPGASIMNATLRDALTRATAGKVLRVGPYLDEQGQTRFDFLTPLATAAGPAPIIVLQISGSHWVNQILNPWPIPDSSGEATLFRQHADQVQYLSDLRYRPDSALRLQLPLHHSTLLAAQYLRLETGQRKPGVLSGMDYRGIAAFGVVYPVAGTDWFLLTKIDKAELNQARFKESIWIGLITLLVLFVTNAGIILLRQHTRLLMAEQIRHSQTQRLQALQLLSAIADSSEDAIFAKDKEGRYILFNRAASQFVGKPAAEMLGQDDMAIFPTKGPLQDNDGQVIGIFGISRDITGFKRAEADLREREGLFRALVEQSLAGIYIIQQGRLCYINPCFAHLFGYDSPGALLGVGTLQALASPEDSDRVAELVLHCEQEGGDIHTRFSALHHGSQTLEVELYGRRVDYRGQPALLGLLLDVTEREQVEQALTHQAMELRQQNEELERFNKVMVDRELAMLTLKHQINTLSRQLGLAPPYPQAPMPPEEHP